MRSEDGEAERGWLRVSGTCRIPLSELRWRVARSGGPGGQHANTSDTRVEVSFDVEGSPSLGPRQRERLLQRLGPVVRAVASDTRSQARNRELALERLADRLGGRVEDAGAAAPDPAHDDGPARAGRGQAPPFRGQALPGKAPAGGMTGGPTGWVERPY